MKLETLGKEIKRAGLLCSVCGVLAGYLALPPLVAQGERRCKDHLRPEWLRLDAKFSGAFVPPSALDEARPALTASAVDDRPGDLFGGL